MASANIKHTTDANFEQDVIKSSIPCLIDLWAEWCGPCKAIAPVLDQIADEQVGKLQIVKLNIDENPETPVKFGVRGIPTLLLFKDGELADQLVGSVPKATLDDFIKKVL